MDAVVVTARGAGTERHWSGPTGAAIAKAFLGAGIAVRWLCPVRRGEAAPAVAGADVLAIPGDVPPFRKVRARVEDAAVDHALVRMLRAHPADVVVHVGCGAPGSMNVLWIADRMGSAGLAVVHAREVLCHRGSLVDARGRDCRSWADADRCRECCTTRARGLPSRRAAFAAKLLRPLGAFSPMPTIVGFRNRLDVVLGSLQLAAHVLVFSEAEQEWLVQAGLEAGALVLASDAALAGQVTTAARAAVATMLPPAISTG